jgi:asparagine synthase (glutamine-hydrolysing)
MRQNAAWQLFFRRGLLETGHPFYSHLIRWQNTAWTLRLLTPEIRAALPFEVMLDELTAELPEDWSDWDPLTRSQYIEIDGFMSSYLLSCQGDRVAMAHGIEARYPFLDPDVVDYCFTLDAIDKLIGTRDKLALRRIAQRRLPPEISARRKQPFRAPIGPALLAPGGAAFEELLSPGRLASSGCFNVAAVSRLLEKARARDGELVGEREEMGLVGVLSLQLLSSAFRDEFAERTRNARQILDIAQCHVLVDRLQESPPP